MKTYVAIPSESGHVLRALATAALVGKIQESQSLLSQVTSSEVNAFILFLSDFGRRNPF